MPADEAQQALVERKADGSDRDHRRGDTERKASGVHGNGEANIATGEIECAVRQIDNTEQAENQTEAARDHEQQRREGRPIEQLEKAHGRSLGQSLARDRPIAGFPPDPAEIATLAQTWGRDLHSRNGMQNPRQGRSGMYGSRPDIGTLRQSPASGLFVTTASTAAFSAGSCLI